MRRFILVFFNDILVYSQSMVEHLTNTFALLRAHKLFVKLSKCAFGQSSLEYLGHIISDQGVVADPIKLKGMQDWPRPTSVKSLRHFLGLTGYHRRFIKGYDSISQPLTNLLKKDAFCWPREAEEAFQSLKTTMMTALVLAMPDNDKSFCQSVMLQVLGEGLY